MLNDKDGGSAERSRKERSVLVDFERNLYVIAAVMPVDFERRFEIEMLTS